MRVLLFASAVLLVFDGCGDAGYRDAVNHDSVDACLRFLEHAADGERADKVRELLDARRYRAAQQADRPLGYHRYLTLHPNGQHAAAARSRLASLLALRAPTAANLALLAERYPNRPVGRRAAARLADVTIAEALAAGTPSALRAALSRYPRHPSATEVREKLARLELAQVPQEIHALEAFIARYGRGQVVAEAEKRLRPLLRREIEITADPKLLAAYAARFPSTADLEQLRQHVAQVQRRRALARLDVRALSALPAASGDLRWVVRTCQRSPRQCARLRRLAGEAGRWRPTIPVKQLAQEASGSDIRAAWHAVGSLGWLEDLEAGETLVELLGSPRLVEVWSALQAFRNWVGLQQTPNAWLERRLARISENHDLADAQRRMVLQVTLGKTSATQSGVAALLADRNRQFLVRYLQLGLDQSEQSLSSFSHVAQMRLAWLEQAFPERLDGASLPTARLLEGELVALQAIVSELKRTVGGGALDSLELRCKNLMGAWRVRLIGANSAYEALRAPDLQDEVVRHERGRERALRDLRREGSRLAKLVFSAVCGQIDKEHGFPGTPKATLQDMCSAH